MAEFIELKVDQDIAAQEAVVEDAYLPLATAVVKISLFYSQCGAVFFTTVRVAH